MSGMVVTRECKRGTFFVSIDETGEVVEYVVTDKGFCQETEYVYEGIFDSFDNALHYFRAMGYSPISTPEDIKFFSMVVNAARQGILLDDLVYDIPGAREQVNNTIIATREWMNNPPAVRVISSVPVEQDTL